MIILINQSDGSLYKSIYNSNYGACSGDGTQAIFQASGITILMGSRSSSCLLSAALFNIFSSTITLLNSPEYFSNSIKMLVNDYEVDHDGSNYYLSGVSYTASTTLYPTIYKIRLYLFLILPMRLNGLRHGKLQKEMITEG